MLDVRYFEWQKMSFICLFISDGFPIRIRPIFVSLNKMSTGNCRISGYRLKKLSRISG